MATYYGISFNLASNAVKNLTEDNLKGDYEPYRLAVLLTHEVTYVAQYNFNMPDFNDGTETPAYLDEVMTDLAVGRYYVNDINELADDADLLATYLNIENPSTEGGKHYETDV